MPDPDLFSPSSINDNRVALTTSNIVFDRIYSATKRKYGLFYIMLGEDEKGQFSKQGQLSYSSIKEITGHKHEVTFSNKLPNIQTTTRGQAEYERVNYTYDNKIFGGYQFDLTIYWHKQPIAESDEDQIAGDEAKYGPYIQRIAEIVAEAWDKRLADDLWINTGQTETTMAGIPFIISTTTSYPFDRSKDANANFRSQKTSAGSAAIALDILALNQNTMTEANGVANLGLCSTQRFTDIQELLQGFQRIEYDPVWDRFGGSYIKYGPTTYVLDQRCPDDTIFHLDTDDWYFVKNNRPFNKRGIVYDPGLVGASIMPFRAYWAIICTRPWAQGYVPDIT